MSYEAGSKYTQKSPIQTVDGRRKKEKLELGSTFCKKFDTKTITSLCNGQNNYN